MERRARPNFREQVNGTFDFVLRVNGVAGTERCPGSGNSDTLRSQQHKQSREYPGCNS